MHNAAEGSQRHEELLAQKERDEAVEAKLKKRRERQQEMVEAHYRTEEKS